MRLAEEKPRRGDTFSTYLRLAQAVEVTPARQSGTPPQVPTPEAARRILQVLQEEPALPIPELMQRSELDLLSFTVGIDRLKAAGQVALTWDERLRAEVARLVEPAAGPPGPSEQDAEA